LPAGWSLTTLGDIASHSTEKAEPASFRDARYIGLEHIEGGSNRISGFGNASNVRSTKAVFRSGDVLYGKLRPYLKKVCQPEFDGVCSTDILVFPRTKYLENGYLLHFLSQPGLFTHLFHDSSMTGEDETRKGGRWSGQTFPLPREARWAKIDKIFTDRVSPGLPPPDERGGEAAARGAAWGREEAESGV
jgi:type I restriction enzyme S subunit